MRAERWKHLLALCKSDSSVDTPNTYYTVKMVKQSKYNDAVSVAVAATKQLKASVVLCVCVCERERVPTGCEYLHGVCMSAASHAG